MVRVGGLPLLVPAEEVDVNPKGVTTRSKRVDDRAVFLRDEIGAPIAALDVRVEPQEPARVYGRSGEFCERCPKSLDKPRGVDETIPRRQTVAGLDVVRFNVDSPDRRDGLHGWGSAEPELTTGQPVGQAATAGTGQQIP